MKFILLLAGILFLSPLATLIIKNLTVVSIQNIKNGTISDSFLKQNEYKCKPTEKTLKIIKARKAYQELINEK